MGLLIDPYVSFDTIDREEMNRCLEAWGHRQGGIYRPIFHKPFDFTVRVHGDPVAVIAADTLIKATCKFTRADAFELSRLCAHPDHHGMASLALKLWRQFAYPTIAQTWGSPWVISYQDAASTHRGNLYRYDHWVKVGYSRSSGSDKRAQPGTAVVSKKVIWGWNADPKAMEERRKNPPERPAWARKEAA